MCITGLQRTMGTADPVHIVQAQGAVSPVQMEQILAQRLQEQQMNRFNL